MSLLCQKRMFKKRQRGFTLVEVLVVISILGIIALIAIPSFAGSQERARVDVDETNARQIIKIARVIASENEISESALDVDASSEVSFPGSGALWSYGGVGLLAVPEPQQIGGTDFELSHTGGSFIVTIAGTSNSITEGQE